MEQSIDSSNFLTVNYITILLEGVHQNIYLSVTFGWIMYHIASRGYHMLNWSKVKGLEGSIFKDWRYCRSDSSSPEGASWGALLSKEKTGFSFLMLVMFARKGSFWFSNVLV